jgi:uncharacterized protein (TIGR04222 family)
MQQPWGLSGPQFLGVYSAAFAASVALVLAIRRVLGQRSAARFDRPLTPYELAFLAGGTDRVLLIGAHELLASGRVHRSRDGRLTRDGDFTANDPLRNAIARIMSAPTAWSVREAEFRLDPAINDLKGTLLASGLVMTARGRRWWLATLLLPVAVWVVGLARVINGAELHLPVADLIMLLIVSAAVVPVLYFAILRRGIWATPVAAALVARLRRQHRWQQRERRRRGAFEAPLAGIAALGVVAASGAMLNLMNAGPEFSADVGNSGGGWLGSGSGGWFGGGGAGCGGGGGCGGGH